MSFVTVLALGLSLLVAAPTLAHLLRRGRVKEQPFPAVSLVPTTRATARERSRLEDRGLLALRALMILCLALLGADNPDPKVLELVFHSRGIDRTFAWSRYRSKELDDLLDSAPSEVNREARLKKYYQAQQIIMENAKCWCVTGAGHPRPMPNPTPCPK